MSWLNILTSLGGSIAKIVTDNLSKPGPEKMDAEQVARELQEIRDKREELKKRIDELLNR